MAAGTAASTARETTAGSDSAPHWNARTFKLIRAITSDSPYLRHTCNSYQCAQMMYPCNPALSLHPCLSHALSLSHYRLPVLTCLIERPKLLAHALHKRTPQLATPICTAHGIAENARAALQMYRILNMLRQPFALRNCHAFMAHNWTQISWCQKSWVTLYCQLNLPELAPRTLDDTPTQDVLSRCRPKREDPWAQAPHVYGWGTRLRLQCSTQDISRAHLIASPRTQWSDAALTPMREHERSALVLSSSTFRFGVIVFTAALASHLQRCSKYLPNLYTRTRP